MAKNGLGTTYPNPMVGSVIVLDGNIIGEGWHMKAGEPHAEVNAINSVKDKSLLKKATIYVNLEPCSHYGKTPPCTDLIIKKLYLAFLLRKFYSKDSTLYKTLRHKLKFVSVFDEFCENSWIFPSCNSFIFWRSSTSSSSCEICMNVFSVISSLL